MSTSGVFLGYGPEDDPRVRCARARGARTTFTTLKANPSGVKVNLTHKYAQICDLIVMLEAVKRSGEIMYDGVPIAGLLPGLYAQAVMTYGHECLHAAQYKSRPALDPDSYRSEIVGGRASEALIEGARWERAYEEEAFAWEYTFAYTVRHELASLLNVFPILRLNMPELFVTGGRFDLLGAERRNEYVEHYLRDRVDNAKAHTPGSKLTFGGVLHLFMDAMVDVPMTTNTLIDTCDAFVAGRIGRADVEESLAEGDRIFREYFEHADAPRLLSCRPFLGDIKPRLIYERARARRLLGGRSDT